MNKLLVGILLLVASSAYAGPLDIFYDAPGSFWGRIDASPDADNNVTHTQFNVEQGLRFEHLKWLTWYGAFTWWQDVSVAKNGYAAAGVKNTTWIPHFTVGIEEEWVIISEPPASTNQHYVVGYISASVDWNALAPFYNK